MGGKITSISSPLRYPFPPELPRCSYAVVANSLTQWIIDTGTTKHIVQDKASFVEFHSYSVGSWTVILENDSEEDILGVGMYQLRLRGGNKLLL